MYGDKMLSSMAKFFNKPLTPFRKIELDNSIHVIWGFIRGSDYIIKNCLKNNYNFVYIDHAYFNSGHKTQIPNYRILINKLNAKEIIDRPDDRLKTHNIEIKPWNKSGNHILVCPPSESSKYFHNCHDWLDKTLEELKKYTDRQIIIRTKPNEVNVNSVDGILHPVQNPRWLRTKIPSTPLQNHLNNCHAVITYNSNISLDAVLNGVPVFISDINVAYPMGLTDLSKIESPIYPDNRYEWCKHLAYCQFNMNEIRSGFCWEVLCI